MPKFCWIENSPEFFHRSHHCFSPPPLLADDFLRRSARVGHQMGGQRAALCAHPRDGAGGAGGRMLAVHPTVHARLACPSGPENVGGEPSRRASGPILSELVSKSHLKTIFSIDFDFSKKNNFLI